MSKLVNWGHLLTAVIMAISGFAFLTDRIIHDVTQEIYGRATFYPVYMRVLWSVPFFMSAWGILRWERWARALAITFCMVELAGFEITRTTGIRHGINSSAILAIVLAVTPLIWGVLPPVRAEYMRRNRTA